MDYEQEMCEEEKKNNFSVPISTITFDKETMAKMETVIFDDVGVSRVETDEIDVGDGVFKRDEKERGNRRVRYRRREAEGV